MRKRDQTKYQGDNIGEDLLRRDLVGNFKVERDVK